MGTSRSVVRSSDLGCLISGFCSSGRGLAPRCFQAPPRDDALALRYLALHLHQVVQGTCTPRLSNMLGARLNRSAVGKTAIATSDRPQPLASPALTSLVACPGALRRAILGPGDAWGWLRSLPSPHRRPAPFPARAPYPSIQSTLKQKRCQSRLRPPPLYPQGRRGLG